jgi:hypothetical protein
MKRTLRDHFYLGLLFSAMLCFSPVGATKAADSSPRTEEALRKGLVAARQKQWDIAIRYFGDAHESAPMLRERMSHG